VTDVDITTDSYSYWNVEIDLYTKQNDLLGERDRRFAATTLLANHLLSNFVNPGILQSVYRHSCEVFWLLWEQEISSVVSSASMRLGLTYTLESYTCRRR
jgi:hypothetical protein